MSEIVFGEVEYDLGSLLKYIELVEIGLPEIQRPFDWKNSKISDPLLPRQINGEVAV